MEAATAAVIAIKTVLYVSLASVRGECARIYEEFKLGLAGWAVWPMMVEMNQGLVKLNQGLAGVNQGLVIMNQLWSIMNQAHKMSPSRSSTTIASNDKAQASDLNSLFPFILTR
jgi:hypothetical protein